MRNTEHQQRARIAIIGFLLGAGLSSAGCDRRQTEVEGEVVQRSVKGVDKGDIGAREVEEGEAEVDVRRRVVVQKIEQLDVPTLRVCQEYADLNEISSDQLVAFGVPAEAAQSIVQYRERNGAFGRVNEITQAEGVGQEVLAQLQNTVAVNPRTGGQPQGNQGQ